MGLMLLLPVKEQKYHPSYKEFSETVWNRYGITKEIAENAGMNPKCSILLLRVIKAL